MTTKFLNPQRPLVDEVVDWLVDRARVVEGAGSLAQFLVVVPTAQSGRNLRLALARAAAQRGWGGVIPPRVGLPMQLVKPADSALREATPVEAAVAFQQYVKAHTDEVSEFDRVVWPEVLKDPAARFALFDQLEDIWRTLAGRGLLMGEVPAEAKAVLESDIGDEQLRWKQLAALEAGYFNYLHLHGVCYPTEAVHAAKTHAVIVDSEIEEIVLPALADPVRVLGDVLEQQLAAGKRVTVLLHAPPAAAGRFEPWGWPKTPAWIGAARPVLDRLKDEDIVCAADAGALARRVAEDYPAAKANAATPSLALGDDALYQGIAAAFLNRGYVVHNPERQLLVRSSLGRLLKSFIALYPAGALPWREFVQVLRSSDVQAALELDAARRESVLKGADYAQNAYLPTTIPSGLEFPPENGLREWQREDLAAFCEVGRKLEAMVMAARSGASLAQFLRRMLQRVFAAHRTGGRADEKEFLAAAAGARDFLAALESPLVAKLNPSDAEFEALARRTLDSVAYSLEPDSTEAIRTEGWLELPWTRGSQVALAGMHEGKVPDSIVGHPFLPDRLRSALGLVTNEDRLARDSWIFHELLESHGERTVRAYVARANAQGDLCRPSRLLYLCRDAELPRRIGLLFGDLPVERTDKIRRVEWPLALPQSVPPPTHLSASAFDIYVKCPFTYLLKYPLRMRTYREKRELEANDFGTFIHEVLLRYARMQIERGNDQLTDAAEIRRVVLEEIAPACRARFANPTLNLELQLQAAEGRLALFAEHQAAWARQGWRIRAAEYEFDGEVAEFGVGIAGSIDRVDENLNADAPKRWCLLDYKTWDEKKLTGHVFTSDRKTERNEAQLAFARQLGFPRLLNRHGEECQRMLSVQLPVYGKAYAEQHSEAAFADMQFSYFILGKNVDETGVGERSTVLTEAQVAAAVETAKRAVGLIRQGIFWPPGPTDEWQWDYPGIFVTDPQTDLADTPWVREQLRRLEKADV